MVDGRVPADCDLRGQFPTGQLALKHPCSEDADIFVDALAGMVTLLLVCHLLLQHDICRPIKKSEAEPSRPSFGKVPVCSCTGS